MSVRWNHFLLLAVGIFVLLSAALRLEAEDKKRKPLRFRIMTFNIRFDFPDDQAAGRGWDVRHPLVARTIKEAKAQIFGTQEDKTEQVADLEKLLPEYGWVGKGRNRDGTGERAAIWYLTSRFSVVQSGDFWLSETPDQPGSISWGEPYPHKVTWVILADKKIKRPVLVLNTHFDDRGEHPRSMAARTIRRWLTENAEKLPVILLGDLNACERDEPLRILLEEGDGYRLADGWVVASPKDPRSGTYHGFKGQAFGTQIDHVLVSPGIRVVDARRVTYDEEGRYPSDHFPVSADIEIP